MVLSVFMCTFANDNPKKVMGIKRNEAAEPQWDDMDYAVRSNQELFFTKRWRRTVDWDIILRQVEKTRQASQMIDIHLYPSKLFFAAIDLLEANLYLIDDMFYYLTGLRLIGTKPRSGKVQNKLGFWNMDCYKVLEQISEGLQQTRMPLIECLKRGPTWNVTQKVLEKAPIYGHSIGTTPIPTLLIEEECAYIYAREHYNVDQIEQETLANQIVNILDLIGHYAYFFFCIYGDFMDFTQLLALFVKSDKAQSEYIEPWRHDFGGTRDNLIAKMEKDPKLAPWVHRYDHLSKDRSVPFQLFYDEKKLTGPVNKEECYNTDNWLCILTIAAILKEYDELHSDSQKTTSESNQNEDDELLIKLSLFFKDEETAGRFLKQIRGMKDRDVITRVKRYFDAHLCFEKSKSLWRVLHDAKLFKTGYNNWNSLLNKS